MIKCNEYSDLLLNEIYCPPSFINEKIFFFTVVLDFSYRVIEKCDQLKNSERSFSLEYCVSCVGLVVSYNMTPSSTILISMLNWSMV